MAAINVTPVRVANPVVGASVTEQVIGELITNMESAVAFRADLVVSGVTVGGGITVKLQHKATGGDFEDLNSANSSVSITGNGTFSITLLAQRTADQGDLPLRQVCRLVVTTGAGSAVTFDNVTAQK